MTNMTSKTLFRTIRSTFGRYAAILAIVALGVGFFMGLKNAQPAMQTTADEYLDGLNMYDFQLISTLGLTSGDIEAFSEIDGIEDAEGGWRLDVLANSDSGETVAYQALSMPERIAIPKLVYGRMPQDEDECVVDASVFSPEDVGKVLTLSEGNDSSTLEQLKYTEYKIVGLVNSPRFISNDRGSTSLGGGTVAGFLYLSKDAFDSDVYHEALLSGAEDLMVFSDEYDDRIEIMSSRVEDVLQERALMRYNEIKSDAQQQISEARAELEDGQAQYDQAISSGVPEELLSDSIAELKQAQREIDEAEDELSELEEPETYVLDLDSNSGCASFENDIAIVDGIANAFPIFFVLIAALVCVTTMTRMVNDERTQIGTLKALGYSEVVISLKYIIYASSAAVIGCVAGFFIGTGVIPQIIWEVYDIRYGFTTLVYYFDPVMYGWCLAVSIFGSIGVTMFACHRELIEKPAELIRPKAPVNGKRIFLEKIRPLWNRLSFLNKVTLRNAFRYKKRMVMMLLGIGGCTALIVTGFGLRDSIANILNYQYDEIMLYDAAVSFDSGEISESEIDTLLSDRNVEHILGYQEDMLVSSEKTEKEATVIAVSSGEADCYFNLHNGNEQFAYPSDNEAVVSSKLAGELGVERGDSLSLTFGGDTVTYLVTGVCDNFLNHYVYVSPDSIPEYVPDAAYLSVNGDQDISAVAAELRSIDGIDLVTVADDERSMMEESMSAIDYIVILVTLFAGALAFVVLYNLTNINIIERNREVATVKVLGFRAGETASYVLRENLMLSIIGALLGLGMGKLLHWYVMSQVQVDIMAFEVRISFWSYLISFICTIAFALISNLLMRFKLDKVNMAESLKSVE